MLRPFIFRCYFSHIFESRALLLRSHFVDFYMFCSHLTLRLFVFFQMYIYMCVCVMYILVKEQAQRHRKMSWLVNFSFWNVPFVLPIPFKRFCNAFVYASTYKLSEEGVSEMETRGERMRWRAKQHVSNIAVDNVVLLSQSISKYLVTFRSEKKLSFSFFRLFHFRLGYFRSVVSSLGLVSSRILFVFCIYIVLLFDCLMAQRRC